MTRLSVLISGHETAFVSETPTGLQFDGETPIEVWAPLTVRLIVAHKRLEWALADCINFGESAYGDLYAQWVTETGLSKKTLANIASVGRSIERSRRREALSFAHHAEVAYLPIPEQNRLLEAAERASLTRYELRDEAREVRERLKGRDTSEPDSLVWTPQKSDLTAEAREELERRLSGIGKRHAVGYERGFLDALLYSDQRDSFRPERWQA